MPPILNWLKFCHISKAFQMHVIRGQGTYDRHSYIEFLALPNRITVQIEYSGEEPEFTQQLGIVLGSLSSLSITRKAPPQIPPDKTLTAIKAQLDNERLTISDGQVEGNASTTSTWLSPLIPQI